MNETSSAPDKIGFQAGAWHFAALLGGNAALALGPWLVRLADTGPVSAAFWRLLLPIPLLALLAWRGRVPGTLPRGVVLLVVAAGLFFAFDLASWHIGIERTRLGNAALFGNAGSVILMVWGVIAMRRLPSAAEGAAILAALAGGAILLGESLEISVKTLAGDLFCLLAGVFYAFYLLPAQRARATLGQWTVLLLVCISAAPVLLVIALVLGEPVFPGGAGWGPVVALAVSSQLIGQGLLVFALKHFSALVIGMALLTQPAIAATVGWLAFGETLSALDILGMALVGGALMISRTARPKLSARSPA